MTQDTAASIGGKGRYRRWLLAAGMLISAVSVIYLVRYAQRHWSELAPLHLTWIDGGWLIAACILYFASLLTTAGAWFFALRALGAGLAALPAFGVALTAQIGKYAPGNVTQHIGRAALASHRGVTIMTTAKASLMEIAIAVAGGALVAAVVGAFSPGALALLQSLPFDPERLAALLVVAGIALLIGTYGVRVWLKRAQRELPWSGRLLIGSLRMLGCYVVSFLLAGLSYYAVTRAFDQSPDPRLCIAVYALAWIAGFVTPGAPAGLGVRESILVVATAGALGPAAVSIAIAHRLVTAVADATSAGAGAWALSRRGVHG